MVNSFQFKQKIQTRQPMIGSMLTLDSSEVAEIYAAAGYDWLFVDMEHSTLDPKSAQRILQAVGNSCPCVLRPPCFDEAWIKKTLDTGAAGILLPRVNSAAQAQQILRFCKYPPTGCRSVGLTRAQGYGTQFEEYLAHANHDIAVIIQIEDIAAINNIEEIVAVPGIDALFIGPYDLSGSMGKTGQVKDPEVLAQIEKVRRAGLEAGLAVGIFTVNPADVKSLLQQGFTLITVGVDTSILSKTLKETLQLIRN